MLLIKSRIWIFFFHGDKSHIDHSHKESMFLWFIDVPGT